MRHKLLTVILICFALFSIAIAANGNISLDSILVEINSSGHSDFRTFRTQISLTYNISASRVEYYYTTLRLSPADIYMAAELAYVAQVPVDRMVQVYRVHKSRGWGYIAKELGIKPGSREFMRLKGKADQFHGKIKYKNKGRKHDKENDEEDD